MVEEKFAERTHDHQARIHHDIDAPSPEGRAKSFGGDGIERIVLMA